MNINIYSKRRIEGALGEVPEGAVRILPFRLYYANPRIAARIYNEEHLIYDFIDAALKAAERAERKTSWDMTRELDREAIS